MDVHAMNARLEQLERMIYGDETTEAMEFGDRRDTLEAEYDELLDRLMTMEA